MVVVSKTCVQLAPFIRNCFQVFAFGWLARIFHQRELNSDRAKLLDYIKQVCDLAQCSALSPAELEVLFDDQYTLR